MRTGGILMHITSLPSPYGIGTMGKEAYEFVDFLEAAGQSFWQILPLGQTGFGDSPYQCCSTFAGNPYLIDLDTLKREGYLTKKEITSVDWGTKEDKIDFGGLYEKRYPVLRKAFKRFSRHIPEDYDAFCWSQGQWLEDYALFMAIKTENDGASWDRWERSLRLREPEAIEKAKKRLGTEMFFWKMLQYFFFKQWRALKAYANGKGIRIIGDLPIYVARDSADTWANPELFDLDEEGIPTEVAGCPPDAFTAKGQLWGNPLFRWRRMREDGYSWWINRVRRTQEFFDVIRIDHFRGFDAYYCVPYGHEDAVHGYWRKGPGLELFRTLRNALGDVDIIAEDLGFLTPSVRKMLRESGYPGMRVLQFAFGGDPCSEYLPQNYVRNCIAYTGTHDNHTIKGWVKTLTPEEQERAAAYIRLNRKEGWCWSMMRAIWSSVADTAIVTMQDLLELPGDARMNEPSTLGKNWMWRAKPGYLTKELAEKLHQTMEMYRRLPEQNALPEESPGSPVPLGERLTPESSGLPQQEVKIKPAEEIEILMEQ